MLSKTLAMPTIIWMLITRRNQHLMFKNEVPNNMIGHRLLNQTCNIDIRNVLQMKK